MHNLKGPVWDVFNKIHALFEYTFKTLCYTDH